MQILCYSIYIVFLFVYIYNILLFFFFGFFLGFFFFFKQLITVDDFSSFTCTNNAM